MVGSRSPSKCMWESMIRVLMGSRGLDVAKVALANILEDELEVLKVEDGGVQLEFGAFEIKTVKVTLK